MNELQLDHLRTRFLHFDTVGAPKIEKVHYGVRLLYSRNTDERFKSGECKANTPEY